MQGLIKSGIIICAVLFSDFMAASANPVLSLYQDDNVSFQQDSTRTTFLVNSLNTYKQELNSKPADSVEIFRNIGMISAELNKPEEAVEYTDRYIKYSTDVSVLHKDSFNLIRNTQEFKTLEIRYLPQGNVLIYIYICIAILGFFFAIVINTKKDADRVANLLLGGFVAVHSMFIFEFAMVSSNLRIVYPHTFLTSFAVALLYGPLLYFYYRRITDHYKFKALDAIHLLPTVFVLVILVPIFMLPAEEKIKFMFGTSTLYSKRGFFIFGFLLKLVSYIIYGILIAKIYFKKENQVYMKGDEVFYKWRRNIYYIHIMYIIAYALYGASVGIIFERGSTVINHAQVLAMALMVLYIAQMAYLNPRVFSYRGFMMNSDSGFSKYLKSGLTPSLSEELKGELVTLLTEDKVYRDSNLNLETLSEKLKTTRHNTSQIINEHFDMNFFELINKFRIEEAIDLLLEDKNGNLNIIDVAYEVGYNNKVTFNKAFKKATSLTPTQFIDSARNNPLVNR